ncbi:MAG: hypothetical protein Q8O16_02425 [Dehalococcoidia bacterium]|nr:hypothetical protein [Dehalococcoidia bacterium]
MAQVIKTLVVEDSPLVQQFLVYVLNSAPGIQVVATAGEGGAAIEAAAYVLPPEKIAATLVNPVVKQEGG